jgi:hypothetical protein
LSKPRPCCFTLGKDPLTIAQEAVSGPQGLVGTEAENLSPTGIRSPDRPARSKSLYRLSYPCPSSQQKSMVTVWCSVHLVLLWTLVASVQCCTVKRFALNQSHCPTSGPLRKLPTLCTAPGFRNTLLILIIVWY